MNQTIDPRFEQRLRTIVRTTLETEYGPHRNWADSPAARRVGQRPERRVRGGDLRLLAIAAVLVTLGLLASLAVVGGPERTPAPSPEASSDIAIPSAAVEPPVTAVWTPDRASQDWPGPVRPEPQGERLVLALTEAELCAGGSGALITAGLEEWCATGDGTVTESLTAGQFGYVDQTGDVAPSPEESVDIIAVAFGADCWFPPSTCVRFNTSEAVAEPLPEPQDEWLAFGLVADTNADGAPDLRYGIDNGDLRGEVSQGHEDTVRMWRTDLGTGETRLYRHTLEDPAVMDAVWPGDSYDALWPTTGSIFAHRLFAPGDGVSPFGFYVWASLIRDGRIVATDYAPDEAWLAVPSAVDVPVGWRKLIVRVNNTSGRTAELLVGDQVSGSAVGDASPGVVSAGADTDVVLTVPDEQSWAVFVTNDQWNSGLLDFAEHATGCANRAAIVITIAGDGRATWELEGQSAC